MSIHGVATHFISIRRSVWSGSVLTGFLVAPSGWIIPRVVGSIGNICNSLAGAPEYRCEEPVDQGLFKDGEGDEFFYLPKTHGIR